MEHPVRTIDKHSPGARVAAVVELILNLGAGDDGQFGRAAGVACPCGSKKVSVSPLAKSLPRSTII